MKLPDFNEFEPFNTLRARMGTKRLGQFDLFDPAIHLTGEERSRLELQGMRLNFQQVRCLPDQTLGYKNGRVVLFAAETLPEELGAAAGHFHVAQCDILQKWLRLAPEGDFQAFLSTRRQAPFYSPDGGEHHLAVCSRCLQALAYQGYDEQRNRKIAYSQQVLREFSLDEYFRLYTQYPVRI